MAVRLLLCLFDSEQTPHAINQKGLTQSFWTPAPRWGDLKEEMRGIEGKGLAIKHLSHLETHLYGVHTSLVHELMDRRLLCLASGVWGGVYPWRPTIFAKESVEGLYLQGSKVFRHNPPNEPEMIIPSMETEAIQLRDYVSDPGDSLFEPRD